MGAEGREGYPLPPLLGLDVFLADRTVSKIDVKMSRATSDTIKARASKL